MIVDTSPVQSNTPTADTSSLKVSVAVPIAKDLRFATDHSVLAPHQHPSFPAAPPSPPVAKPFSGYPEEGHNQQPIAAPIVTTTATVVSETVGTPNFPALSQSPSTSTSTDVSNNNPLTIGISSEPAEPDTRKIGIKDVLKWGVAFSLAGVGVKGFFDALYFITVEFQNFEKALENHFVESATFSSLITKASFLVFSTALSTFFGMQLVMTNTKRLHWLRLASSVIVGLTAFLVIQYASTINVLDSFK